jgi:hypothetical protein
VFLRRAKICETLCRIYEQDRQCTYNVKLNRLRETAVAAENNKYYIFLCVGARAWACERALVGFLILYSTHWRHIICILSVSTLFFVIISLAACFSEKNICECKMCVFIFSTAFVQNTSHSVKNLTRYYHKCETSLCKVLVIFSDFN